MARFKSYLLVVIGFAVAGMIGAAFGTGTAQAIVATLVEVVNPTTSPVATSSVNVTDPGRIAYQSTVNNVGKCSGSSCLFAFPTVPAGHRVVVQHIGGVVSFVTAPSTIMVEVETPGALVLSGFLTPVPTTGFGFSVFVQPVLFYVDGMNSIQVAVLFGGNGATFTGDGNGQLENLV